MEIPDCYICGQVTETDNGGTETDIIWGGLQSLIQQHQQPSLKRLKNTSGASTIPLCLQCSQIVIRLRDQYVILKKTQADIEDTVQILADLCSGREFLGHGQVIVGEEYSCDVKPEVDDNDDYLVLSVAEDDDDDLVKMLEVKLETDLEGSLSTSTSTDKGPDWANPSSSKPGRKRKRGRPKRLKKASTSPTMLPECFVKLMRLRPRPIQGSAEKQASHSQVDNESSDGDNGAGADTEELGVDDISSLRDDDDYLNGSSSEYNSMSRDLLKKRTKTKTKRKTGRSVKLPKDKVGSQLPSRRVLFKGADGKLRFGDVEVEITKGVANGYKCVPCNQAYTQTTGLFHHIRVKHRGERTVRICDNCGKSFKKQASFKCHLQVCIEGKLFHCEICGRPFKCSQAMRRHTYSHKSKHELEAEVGTGTNSGNTPYHVKAMFLPPRLKPLKTMKVSCEICGKAYDCKAKLLIHSNSVHVTTRAFTCTTCSKSYKTAACLRKHKKSTHLSDRAKFECSVCLKTFPSNHAFTIHYRSHTGERPFLCSICGKAFPSSSWLTKHRKIHTERKSYACTNCGRKFGNKTNVDRHTRDHGGFCKAWLDKSEQQ